MLEIKEFRFTIDAQEDALTQILPAPDLHIQQQLTVAAWVHSDICRAEAMQPLISQWVPRSDFNAFDAFDAFDAGHTDDLSTRGYFGAVFDGRYVYFCPVRDHQDRYSVHGRVLRYDTQAPFHSAAAWAAYDAGHTDGLRTVGFYGGAFDGRYVYYMPFTRNAAPGESVFHCNWLRYDTTGVFTDPASWSAHDASFVDNMHTTAYNAGAFDGRYFYTAPWRGDRDEGAAHGRVLRYDTLDRSGTFSLRYGDFGHNGGLCAGLLGPSFIVNTTQGAISIAIHRALEPGSHHLVGVYDGAWIKLYIDGSLAAQRRAQAADAHAAIRCPAPLMGDVAGVKVSMRVCCTRARVKLKKSEGRRCRFKRSN